MKNYITLYKNRPCRSYYEIKNSITESLIKEIKHVIHIGGHIGQEASWYDKHSVKVVWIEADPVNYLLLKSNLLKYRNQKAVNALLGSTSRKDQTFFRANNQGQSSSIYDFGDEMNHSGLRMIETINLPMTRADKLFDTKQVKKYQYWVIDVQGAELEVLKGAGQLLQHVKVLQIEVSTKDEYKNGARFDEIKAYLKDFGFFPLWIPKDNSHEDIIFLKISNSKVKRKKISSL